MKSKEFFFKISLFALILCSTSASYSQQLEYARSIIKTLASPAFKGRGYVENGDKIASSYIAAEFKKSNVLPLNKGSYFQYYTLPVNTFPGKVEVELNGKALVPGADYLVDASSPSVHGTFDVVRAKEADIAGAEKLSSLVSKAANSFILLDLRKEDNENTEKDQQAIAANIKALRSDAGLNFKGLIILTDNKLTWTTETYQSKRPVIIVNKADIEPVSITTLNINIDSKFIPKYTTRNVAGMIKGTSGSDSTIVISAHFDHLGLMGKNVYFPGANDNASGVAMLLCFVRYYAAHPPKYNTVFLAFSGEEIGILGSKAFVDDPLTDLKKIKFLVNFDLAGTGDEGIKVVNGTVYKDKFVKLVDLNKEYNLVPAVEIRGEACKSDHCRFYAKGVPCFFIYTLGGIKAYHDIYDRAETLPLTEFKDYFDLMVKFFNSL
jgi:hypothetical protein